MQKIDVIAKKRNKKTKQYIVVPKGNPLEYRGKTALPKSGSKKARTGREKVFFSDKISS